MDTLDERYKAFIAKHGIYGPKNRERKPVVEIPKSEIKRMWEYDYQAKKTSGPSNYVLASNSLQKLKEAVKDRRWLSASLSCKEGAFSVGQTVVHEYPFEPKYKRR